MLNIPIVKETLQKSLLGGKGDLQITTDKDAWAILWDNDAPFTTDVDRIADLSVKVGTGAKEITLGEKDNINLTLQADAAVDGAIELIWPDENSNQLIKDYGLGELLTADKLYLALHVNGSVSASGKAEIPKGALSAAFEAGAGGSAGFVHLKPYLQTLGARTILEDLFQETRFPQRIDTLDEIPGEGEVLALTYSGYLNLGATLTWGYQLNGVKGWSPGELDLTFSYLVKAAASLKLSYRLAGKHTLQARRGHADGWVRFVVNKGRESSLGFAADLGVTAEIGTDGLPPTADEFLAALLGTDVGSALGYLKEAQKYDSLAKIQEQLDKLAIGFVDDLSKKLIGKALSNATLKSFLTAAREIVETYESLDQKLLAVYEKHAGNSADLRKLTQRIDDLATITGREGLLAWVEGKVPAGVKDKGAWELVRDEWGDELYDVLLDNEAFAAFRKWIVEAQKFLASGVQEKIATFAATVKSSLGLDGLVAEIKKYDSAEKLQAAADARIAGFVSRITGEAFDTLKGSDLAKVFKRLQGFLGDIQKFKDTWYEKLREASEQSVALQVAYNYTRTRQSESLIDVEVNLADGRGAALAQAASKGDFAATLTEYDPQVVRINPGTRLTRNLQTSSQLQINLFGRKFSRAVDIVQNLERFVETSAAGLIHVYALDNKVDLKKRSNRESQNSTFLLQGVGVAVQNVGAGAPVDRQGRFLVQTLRKLAASYELTQKDQKTTWAELQGYLELGRELGLLTDAKGVIDQLKQELPGGPGEVEVKYVVRFDPEGLRNVFTVNNTAQVERARRIARQVVSASLLSAPANDPRFALGAGYASGEKDLFLAGTQTVSVPVPAAFKGKVGSSGKVFVPRDKKFLVWNLFLVEQQFVKRFVALDDLIDRMLAEGRPVPVDELAKAARDLAEMNAKLEDRAYGDQSINVFFVILDRLVRASSGGRAKRQSALSVTLTPQGGEKVSKMFVDDGTPETA